MLLQFSDGMQIETSGKYRVVSKRDGLYVVGHGLCCAVDTQAEGAALIAQLKQDLSPCYSAE